jgi:hypothetical protein
MDELHLLPVLHANSVIYHHDLLIEAQGALGLVLILGAEESRKSRARRRNPSRLYLCRPQLLPNPRTLTPWQQVYESQDDRAFITTTGFDVATFHLILENGFAEVWNTTPIPRDDTSSNGNPRLGRRSLDAAGALGLVLYYLSSAMLETGLQQIFALIPSTVSRYLRFARVLLLGSLRQMKEAAISFPREEEEYAALNALIVGRHSRLTGAFGSIDGLSLAVMEADDPEIENATYNGWKSSHNVNNVIVFSPRGRYTSTIVGHVMTASQAPSFHACSTPLAVGMIPMSRGRFTSSFISIPLKVITLWRIRPSLVVHRLLRARFKLH